MSKFTIHCMNKPSLAVVLAVFLSNSNVTYAKSKYEDDGKAIQAEFLCETVNVSHMTDWPSSHPEDAFKQDNFSFVVKVKDAQIKIFGGDYRIHQMVAKDLGWMPIKSIISYQTWEASGNWGRHVSALESKVYFSRLDVHNQSIFSFVAKCQEL